MLHHLSIRHLAIVEHIDIEFHAGMTVITGETGAGKSILLDALHLALGERMEVGAIKQGAERAEISAIFDISRLPGAVIWLAELELNSLENPQDCIIRRVLYTNGRSRAFINGKTATTQQLKLLGEHLVQIHGQHQHQLLLKNNEQLRILDAFGQHQGLTEQVKKLYHQLSKLIQEKHQLQQLLSQDSSRLDFLNYQIAELTQLQLMPGEVEQLHIQQKQLAHGSHDHNIAQSALRLLNSDTNSFTTIPTSDLISLSEQFHQAVHKIIENYPKNTDLKHIQELSEINKINFSEIHAALQHFTDNIPIDPEQLILLEQRLEIIYTIARKHRVQPEALSEHAAMLQSQADQLNQAEQKIQDIELLIQQIEIDYLKIATQLSKARTKAALLLSQEITTRMQNLGMPGGLLEIQLIPVDTEHKKYTADGLELASFFVSANPGHPVQPLHKVASGGELSRISLAIQLISAAYLKTPTLIFDEVDVGVGGKIGAIVGSALRTLGKSAQVICITHLPQVASQGEHHLHVAKSTSKKDTSTTVSLLDTQARAEEIARMLEGLDTTPEALAHAKRLLNEAKLNTITANAI